MGFNISRFGGGDFVPYSGVTVISTPSGVSGDVYDITPAAGNTLRVTRLNAEGASTEENITVTITNNSGQVNILDNGTLGDSTPTSSFFISQLFGTSNVDSGRFGIPFVDCKRIVVTKVSGSTSNPIGVAYIEGRFE